MLFIIINDVKHQAVGHIKHVKITSPICSSDFKTFMDLHKLSQNCDLSKMSRTTNINFENMQYSGTFFNCLVSININDEVSITYDYFTIDNK